MASYVGNYVVNPAFPAQSMVAAIVDETPRFKAYMDTVKAEFTYLSTRPTPGPM